MIRLPENSIIIWPGTNASIPTGFVRETSLDGKFPKVADGEPGDSGGNATHTHTVASAHNHTIDNHTHAITLGNGVNAGADAASGGVSRLNHYNHSHSGTTGNPSDVTVSSETPSYSAISNDPEYETVIFIKSDGTTGIPVDACVLIDETVIPTDYAIYSSGKFIKGATTGANAGGAGGSSNNAHILTHSHTQTHRHSDVTLWAPARTLEGKSSYSTPTESNLNHSHIIYPLANTDGVSSNPLLTTTEVVEPEYKKLCLLQSSSSAEMPTGIIILWLGTVASMPTGSAWTLLDGTNTTIDMRGKYIKIGTAGEIGDTGGANTHTHTTNHSHSLANHVHTHGNATHPSTDWRTESSGAGYVYNQNTYHTVSIGGGSIAFSTVATTAGSSSNEPEYLTVALLKYTGVQEIDLTESVAVEDNSKVLSVLCPQPSENITIVDSPTETIRTGRSISIHYEGVGVSESVHFPGPGEFMVYDNVPLTEKVTVKIFKQESETYKPSLNVGK